MNKNLIICLLQDANRLLSGERGYVHLKNLEKMLRVRQQHMISQVSFLYPVKPSIGSLEQELESFPSSSRAGIVLKNIGDYYYFSKI